MMNKNTLKLEFTKEDNYIHLGLSDNFNAHNKNVNINNNNIITKNSI